MTKNTMSVKMVALVSAVATALTLAVGARVARADHPVSVSRALVYVSEEQATAKIEVFLEDLFLFHDLKPNDQDFLEPTVIRRGMELHKQFVKERFVIRDAAGEPIAGRLVEARFAMPDEGVPLAELMAHRLTFELAYEFAEAPEFLTFRQQFTDAEAVLPSEMKLIVQQENATEPQTAELRPGDIETMRFSWTLPPLSPEASAAERAKWETKQNEETLGITSYSSVYSFLYIEDNEVRHEILIPLLTLEQSVLIARDEDEFLDLDEQDAAREQIAAYFRSGNPIEINGTEVSGTVQRCDFYGLAFKDFALQAPKKKVPLASARVGVILAYPAEQIPRSVQLTWNRFNSFVWTVNTVVFAFDEIKRITLARLGKQNVFQWEGDIERSRPAIEEVAAELPPSPRLPVPLFSVLCLALAAAGAVVRFRGLSIQRRVIAVVALLVGAILAWPFLRIHIAHPFAPTARIDRQAATAAFSSLHRNMYRAFAFRDEERVYDALSKTIDGDLLRDVYLQIRKGLEMQEQGGAVSRIASVEIVEGQREGAANTSEGDGTASNSATFVYRCRWNVAGTVEHWGHIHQRVNQYEARFTVEAIDSLWKITGLELLDEQRLDFNTRLRS